MENRQEKVFRTKTNDVDEVQGIVTVAVNGIGIKDSDGEISESGSFDKTLKENFPRVKWLLNHDVTKLLGVPLEGREEDGNLVMSGKINLKKEIGRDTLEDYKLYAENGRTLEHSIGVKAVKRDVKDKARVKEWMLWEYSTLTGWGANPQTFLMDIKGLKGERLKDHIELMRKALSMRYSDEKLKSLEMNLAFIEKALTGQEIVSCSSCGLAFDYNGMPEESLEQQVLNAVGNYTRWMADDIVRIEMEKLKPEIQERVMNIIESKKSVDDFGSFVRCPKCYSRVYSTSRLITTKKVEPPIGTQANIENKAGNTTLLLKGILSHIN